MVPLALLVCIASLLLIVLIARLSSLASNVRDLEARVGMIERRQGGTLASPVPGVMSSPSGALPVTAPSAPGAGPVPGSAMPSVAGDHPAVVSPRIEPVVRTPSRTRGEWEALIGGKLLNRIGALALIIGVGFFLKYAVDNAWIDERTRVLIGVTVGLISLWGAERTRTRGFQIFSQGLVGAGIAILYLSVYASFNFYQLVSLPVAFVLKGVVTVLAFVEAIRNDSVAVSLLACAGGLLTPLLLSTGESHEAGLFVYLIILNLGVLLILVRKPSWVALEPLLLIGTYAVYFIWFTAYYTTVHTLAALLFLVMFWAIHHGLDIFRVVAAEKAFAGFRRALGWLHTALSFGALYGICMPHGDSPTALAATIAAALYLSSSVVLERRRAGVGLAAIQYALAGSTFLAWAVALHFEGFTIPLLWTMEGVVLVWLGTRFLRRYVWIVGLLLLGMTALTLLGLKDSLAASSLEAYRPILNLRALAYILLAASVCVSTYLIRTAIRAGSAVLGDVLHYGWLALVFTVVTVETNDLFRSWMLTVSDQQAAALGFARFMIMAVVWSLYSLVLVWMARRADVRPVVFAGISLALGAACLAGIRGIVVDPLTTFVPVFNIRVVTMLVVVVVMFVEVRWLKGCRVRSSWIPELREAVLILGVTLLLVLFTGETRDVFEKAMADAEGSSGQGSGEETSRLEDMKQLSLSGVWLVFSVGVMAFGIWRRSRILRHMAIILFGVTILKIFTYDLSFLDTLYRIFSFVALGLILLAVSYLYQRYRDIILGPSGVKGTSG